MNFRASVKVRHLAMLLLCAGVLQGVSAAQNADPIKDKVGTLIKSVQDSAESWNRYDVLIPPNTELTSARINGDKAIFVFNRYLGYRIWDMESVKELKELLRQNLGDLLPADASIEILVHYQGEGTPVDRRLEDHVTSPAEIRAKESARKIPPPRLAAPVINRLDYPGPERSKGLEGRQIVIGPSHGYTWHQENRWQFQRARVYTTIEDLFPMSYVNPFLLPMLENAGATVWPVRERDYQLGEVIVDNDAQTRYSTFTTEGEWSTGPGKGWRGGRPIALDQDTAPFTLGTTMRAEVHGMDDPTSSTAVYTPYVPHQGQYAVYVSWPMAKDNSVSVPVDVHHLGGVTHFDVNQQVAGNTWVCLGFFEFDQGADAAKGSVTFSTNGAAQNPDGKTYVSIDAVRFGGGNGNIAAADQISQKPRYAEASCYWLQYSGAPKEEVYLRRFNAAHFGPDYWSDIAARAEWTNYLTGAPGGPNPVKGTNYRNDSGLGIPVDMFLAFHTDAGYDEHGLIGTLLIYRVWDDIGNDVFPDGRSRWINRDLAALIQEEIVRTARTEYTSEWSMRHLWERDLGETRRPNVPSALIELLSHHNYNDMKYGTDPRFQKDMARALYKGIARFIAYSHGYEPTIEPLEPTHLVVQQSGSGRALLQWRAQADPLEPSAVPTGFIVYTSKDGRSWDNGRYVREAQLQLADLPENQSVFFRVTAANEGGESLPSRVVGTRWISGRKPVLVVDGFDRISGPASVHRGETQGFDRRKDRGVYYNYNYALVGDTYDFDAQHEWVNDLESPGMGGSQNLMDNFLEKGNTFDHVVTHGAALADNGVPFDSALSEAFTAGMTSEDYPMIDWIAGRERTVDPWRDWQGTGTADQMNPQFEVLNAEARKHLRRYLAKGGKLLISGAHIVEDLRTSSLANEDSRDFAEDVLSVETYLPDGTSANQVEALATSGPFSEVPSFYFGRDLYPPANIEPTVYPVDHAEAFIPNGSSMKGVLQYGDTQTTAAIASDKIVLCGFPIETMLPAERRSSLVGAALVNFGIIPKVEKKEDKK